MARWVLVDSDEKQTPNTVDWKQQTRSDYSFVDLRARRVTDSNQKNQDDDDDFASIRLFDRLRLPELIPRYCSSTTTTSSSIGVVGVVSRTNTE